MTMVTPDQMVVVDGIRYRPEDAPKAKAKPEPEQKATPAPRNKARTATNK